MDPYNVEKKKSAAVAAPFVVVLANGAFPQSEKALAFLRGAARLVCCDGAVNKAVARGVIPDYIVGDLDSIEPELKERFVDRLIRVSEQESNDLAKALRFCISKAWQRIVILGASGEREDHLIGNVSQLADFADKVESLQIVTDYGRFLVATSSGVFPSYVGQQISIFSFDPRQEFSSQGLKYPLCKLRLPRWHTATLNEALNESFSLTFTPEAPVILFFADFPPRKRSETNF